MSQGDGKRREGCVWMRSRAFEEMHSKQEGRRGKRRVRDNITAACAWALERLACLSCCACCALFAPGTRCIVEASDGVARACRAPHACRVRPDSRIQRQCQGQGKLFLCGPQCPHRFRCIARCRKEHIARCFELSLRVFLLPCFAVFALHTPLQRPWGGSVRRRTSGHQTACPGSKSPFAWAPDESDTTAARIGARRQRSTSALHSTGSALWARSRSSSAGCRAVMPCPACMHEMTAL